VSPNGRGYVSPISNEGMYLLVADKTSPKINDLHIDWNDDHPVLLCRISENGSGINLDSLRIEGNGKTLPFSFDETKKLVMADLSRLPRGMHRFEVEISDFAENKGKGVLAQVLHGPLSVAQVTAYPNPAKNWADLAVILDGNGSDDPSLEAEAKIFDSSGAKVITLPLVYKANRTFVSRWNLRNEDGKTVSNGVYFFKVVIRKGGEELKGHGKLAVLN